MHVRLKCCDDRFAANPQFIFHALDWIKRNAAVSSVHFAERKQFQSEISAGQLVNHNNLRRMVSCDQIFSSFKNRGTLQCFHNMQLDVLAKIRQLGVHFLLDLFCCWITLDWNDSGCCSQIQTDEQWIGVWT